MLSMQAKMFVFEFPNIIPSLILISLITFSNTELNIIDDSAFPCFKLVVTLTELDVFDTTITSIYVFFRVALIECINWLGR